MSDTGPETHHILESAFAADHSKELIQHGANVVQFDADHTLFGIEGIDEAAALRGPEVFANVAALTGHALGGQLDVHYGYTEKFAMVQPDKKMVAYLAELYANSLSPDAITMLKTLQELKIGVGIISGGFEKPIRMALARKVPGLRIGIRANQLKLNKDGTYGGFDVDDLAAHQHGKRRAIQFYRDIGKVHGHIAMVGDAKTDLESHDPAGGGADSFIKFTKYTNRHTLNAPIETNDYGVLLVLLTGEGRWSSIYRGNDTTARNLLMRGMLTILADTVGTTRESMDANGYVEFKTDDPALEYILRGKIQTFLQKHEGWQIVGSGKPKQLHNKTA